MKKICILGSGYAGLFCASNLLSDKSYKNKFEITVIDKNSYHQLLQQIHLVCSGIKKPEEISFSISDLLKDEIKFFKDIVVQVNFHKQNVLTASNTKYEFDYLIIALGATNSYFEIEGAKEFSQSFRSLDDAIELQKKIQQKKHKNIVICGGGATGISLAGALSEKINKKNIKIIIVEAQSDILSGWNRNLVKTIKVFLENKNVDLITNNPIKEVKPSSVLLTDGKIIQDCLSIWTAGVKGCDLSTIPEIKRTHSNRIIVNKFSQIDSYENIFAIGDISAFSLANGQNSPQLAQFAVRQAKNVAKNILKIENEEKMMEFHY